MPEHIRTGRYAPGWVRAYSDRALHGLAGHLRRRSFTEDLSDAQVWLFEACCNELEYRARRCRPTWRRCVCDLCLPPFTFPDLD